MTINKYIDHTILKVDAIAADIERICAEAIQYDFYAVCVNPINLTYAKMQLKGSNVKLASVIGFPLGECKSEVKAYETSIAVAEGADEIDMVISVSRLKDKDYEYVKNDIISVVKAANGKVVKVILETGLLTEKEIATACKLASDSGAHCVKTSTGFLGTGATISAIEIMKNNINQGMFIKASGGIRNLEQAQAMINAGAMRIGVSSGVAIMQEYLSNNK